MVTITIIRNKIMANKVGVFPALVYIDVIMIMAQEKVKVLHL